MILLKTTLDTKNFIKEVQNYLNESHHLYNGIKYSYTCDIANTHTLKYQHKQSSLHVKQVELTQTQLLVYALFVFCVISVLLKIIGDQHHRT